MQCPLNPIPTVAIQASPKQATHVHIFLAGSLFIFLAALFPLVFYAVFFHMQLKRKCSQITHMQNEHRGRGRGSRGKSRRLVYWFRAGFACISVAPHISSMKALGLLADSDYLAVPQTSRHFKARGAPAFCNSFAELCGKLTLSCGSSLGDNWKAGGIKAQ